MLRSWFGALSILLVASRVASGIGMDYTAPSDAIMSPDSVTVLPPDCNSFAAAPFGDASPAHGLYGFQSYDSWRGLPDGGHHNDGINVGLNYGTRLGRFSEVTGCGLQIGGSLLVSNFSGTDYRLQDHGEAEEQGFFTYGLFHRAHQDNPFTASLVQDWMLNHNFGVFNENPTLSQWRGQFGYVVSDQIEIGVWGSWRAMGDSRTVANFGATSWRPVNQMSIYWRYHWQYGADTTAWFGIPEHTRLTRAGSLGAYNTGAMASTPLSDRVQLYTLVTYMSPSAAAGDAAAQENQWNFTIGLAFYPWRNAHTGDVRGERWMPLTSVANNGTFMVDTNKWY